VSSLIACVEKICNPNNTPGVFLNSIMVIRHTTLKYFHNGINFTVDHSGVKRSRTVKTYIALPRAWSLCDRPECSLLLVLLSFQYW